MTTPVNPYVAGNPVGDSPAFIGRADVLREVLRVLRRSQDNAIVLYGQRRIGKTSILQHLAAWLPREGTYRPVYFDLQDKAAWPLGRVLQDLAYSIAHTLGQPDPDLGPDSESTFRQEWLPAVLDDLPQGSSLVLLFDEFDVLADPKTEQAAAAFFPYLRDLLALDPQRLQFAFAIGRNVGDLANIALSLFKGTPYQRVSLLDWEDTADLVHLSEVNDTLRWPDGTAERVWQLTHGHPFLTQQLCSHVWERAYDEEPGAPPTVTPTDVEAAVSDALEASGHAMEWLWDGLPPAERVVASALAEAGPGPITQNELEQLLHESGVRVVIRELQNAPQLLQDWDLIEPADGGYRFRVELLRHWIAESKPLRRMQEELDRIEPAAENLYQAALGLYQGGQLDQAIEPLRQAISLNPNHVRANQLLADILLAQGQIVEALRLLIRLYQYQPIVARPRLVQALLAQAQATESGDEELSCYQWGLELDPTQPEALAGQQRMMEVRGRTSSLSPWNPLDHLRLLCWMMVVPQRLKAYRKIFSKKDESRVGKWLVNTLTWLPFLVPTLALGLGTLPRAEEALSSTAYLGISLGLVLLWVLIGWLEERANEYAAHVLKSRMAVPLGSVLSFVVGGVVGGVAFSVAVGLPVGGAGIVAFAVAGSVALSVTFGMTYSMGHVVEDATAFLVAVTVLLGLPLGVMLGGLAGIEALGEEVGGIALFASFVLAIIVALCVALCMEQSLKIGRPYWLMRGAFGALLLAHAFLVWVSFLGGWRVFQ
jgi:tetratricopeptide (TPR) repeat protein